MLHLRIFKHSGLLALLLVTLVCTSIASAQQYIVKDGKAQAQIVISPTPQRTTLLAARELQTYIEKITGARLAIVTTKDNDKPVNIYVGQSEHTDKLGIKTDALIHGSYRIASGENWLALIGKDTNYTPIKPWASSRKQRDEDHSEAGWDKITGNHWGWPMRSQFKFYLGKAMTFDASKPVDIHSDEPLELWQYDERGSFNAVCGFLRSQGVRWYMPGEIGEVIPKGDTMLLPRADYIERPDVQVRQFNNRFGVATREVSLWFMHLGERQEPRQQIAHGLALMTEREEYKQAHPDYYALYGGKRATERNHLCLSSPGLFEDTVKYTLTLMEKAGLDEVSIMPNDAFIALCQCPLCEGKSAPERGYRGVLSDYVWTFVNNVAREVGKTYPDKKILCLAYGTYREPPASIEKLEPNVRVGIVNGRGPKDSDPADLGKLSRIYQAWLPKTDNKILNFENYPFTSRGFYLPAYQPITIGKGINASKEYSMGEDIWLSVTKDFKDVGFNHLNVYFTARSWWGGQNDVDAMFDEYCTLFYGPAAAPMKKFFQYCEANWKGMAKDGAAIDKVLALFEEAKAAVEADSIHGQRIALVDKYLTTLRSRKDQLAKEMDRTGVPTVHYARGVGTVKIDGILDDKVWTQSAGWGKGRLRDLVTGEKPDVATSFRVAWEKNNLYFGIRCEEPDMANMVVSSKTNDDQSIWYGDTIELLIETDKESYYQIAINANGAITDLYRPGGKGKGDIGWDSQAEIATHKEDGAWTIEIRLPVIEETEDPLNQIIGSAPLATLPWYFNVGRSRTRDGNVSLSAFSPTGSKSFHVPHKFAKLDAKTRTKPKDVVEGAAREDEQDADTEE